MVFSEEEIANGLERLARAEGAKFLRQLLLDELLYVPSDALEASAFLKLHGRRSLARDLLRKLPFDNAEQRDTAEPSAAELAQRAPGRAAVERNTSRRRVPVEPDA